jgi:hypothetical protein
LREHLTALALLVVWFSGAAWLAWRGAGRLEPL